MTLRLYDTSTAVCAISCRCRKGAFPSITASHGGRHPALRVTSGPEWSSLDVLRRWMMARLRRDVFAQRHRHRRQDPAPAAQEQRLQGGRPALRAGIQPRLNDPWPPAANSGTPRHRPHSADDRISIGRPLDSGAAYAVGGDVYFGCLPGLHGRCPGSGRTTCRPQRTRRRRAQNAIPATSHCGRPLPGSRRGIASLAAGLAPGVPRRWP